MVHLKTIFPRIALRLTVSVSKSRTDRDIGRSQYGTSLITAFQGRQQQSHFFHMGAHSISFLLRLANEGPDYAVVQPEFASCGQLAAGQGFARIGAGSPWPSRGWIYEIVLCNFAGFYHGHAHATNSPTTSFLSLLFDVRFSWICPTATRLKSQILCSIASPWKLILRLRPGFFIYFPLYTQDMSNFSPGFLYYL